MRTLSSSGKCLAIIGLLGNGFVSAESGPSQKTDWVEEAKRMFASASYRAQRDALLAWNRKETVEAYRASGRKNPKWDKAAEESLEFYARYVSTGPYWVDSNELRDATQQALQAGCDDPLVWYANAYGLHESGDLQKASTAYVKAADGIGVSKYSPVRKIHALMDGLRFDRMRNQYGQDEQLRKRLEQRLQNAIKLIPDLAADVQTPKDVVPHVVLRIIDDRSWINPLVDPEEEKWFFEVHPKVAAAFPNGLQALKLKGAFYCSYGKKRWGAHAAARQEAAKRFAIAKDALEQAWQKDPTDDFVPYNMMVIMTFQDEGREALERWFRRALQTGTVGYRVFSQKMWYLRDHGSTEELLSYGRDCLRTEHWESRIPLILSDIHMHLGRRARQQGLEKAEPDRSEYFKRKDVWADMTAAMEPFLKAHPNADRERNLYAFYAAIGEHWEPAQRQFEQIGEKPVEWVFQGRALYDELRKRAAQALGKPLPTSLVQKDVKPIINSSYPLLPLPWLAIEKGIEDLRQWEQVDLCTEKGQWKVENGAISQTSNVSGGPNKISTALMLKGNFEPPCTLRFTVDPEDNDMFGVLLCAEDVQNTYQVLFNADYGPYFEVSRIQAGKKTKALQRHGGYVPKKKAEIEISWGRSNQADVIKVRYDGEDCLASMENGESVLRSAGRIGFFCNGMQGVKFGDIRVEKADAATLASSDIGLQPLMATSRPIILEARRGKSVTEEIKAAFADPVPPKKPFLFVFPLRDEKDRNSALGWLVSRSAMFHATFLPEPVQAYPAGACDQLLKEWLFHMPERAVPSGAYADITTMLGVKEYWRGTIKIDAAGYEAKITIVNAAPGRPFQSKTYVGPQNQIHLLPQKMASDIHAYLGISVTAEQRAVRDVLDVDNAVDFQKAAEQLMGTSMTAAERWAVLSKLSLDKTSTAFLDSELLLAYCEDFRTRMNDPGVPTQKLLEACTKANPTFADVLLEKYLCWRNATYVGDYRDTMVPNLTQACLTVLRQQPYHHLMYRLLATSVIRRPDQKSIQQFGPSDPGSFNALWARWKDLEPNNAGCRYWQARAWEDRGIFQRASLPFWDRGETDADRDARQRQKEYLTESMRLLKEAIRLNPTGAREPTAMISLITWLSGNRTEMEKYFQAAIAANPAYPNAYQEKMNFLMPFWHGSAQAALAFGRECLRTESWEANIPLLLISAHGEVQLWTGDPNNINRQEWIVAHWREPETWKDVEEFYHSARKANARLTTMIRSFIAVMAAVHEKWDIAEREFQALGDGKNLILYWPLPIYTEYRRKTLERRNPTPNSPKKDSKTNVPPPPSDQF